MALSAFLCMAFQSSGAAASTADDEIESLRQRIEQLEKRLEQLTAENDHWLSARRAEDIRALVDEVLADAATRPALSDGGFSAGHDGRNFFLRGGDSVLRLTGQIQARSVTSFRESGPTTTDPRSAAITHGNEIRRMKLGFRGTIDLGQKFDFNVVLAHDRATGIAFLEEANVATSIFDSLTIYAGRIKAPFAKEELISSSRQMAVDRSAALNTFTVGWVEGIGARITIPDVDAVRFNVMVHDGHASGAAGPSDSSPGLRAD
ncbi:MAG: hypothetical protein JJU36_03325, partial [Phycisphaeraceae bacterium]|nr:hypothetical protein [Phycisphaeraceae bacterium]